MADRREVLQRATRASAGEVRQAWCEFQILLQTEMRRRIQEAGETIEALLEYGQIQEAWDRISWW